MQTINKTAVRTEEIREIVQKTGLKHIAIIMDGNRRWAKEKHLPSAMGHKQGVQALRNAVEAAHTLGVKYLTLYAFSTENWNRKPEEVEFLMGLLASTIRAELDELHQNNVKLRFLGDLSAFNPQLQEILKLALLKTQDNTGVNLQLAINYGSRNEITHALKSIVEQGIPFENINEDLISQHLYTRGIPDPDLLIRTGGEMRISNYLLWQIAYSEIYVTETFWPDFDQSTMSCAINEFGERSRRFGG